MLINEGQVDENKFFNDDWMGRGAAEKARELDAAIRKHMSPKGELGLPPLLDERRLQYGIPDEAFAEQAVFTRLYVWQLSDLDEQETFGDSRIILTENLKKAERTSAPGGIIISAGLCALDELRSNGIDLGHRITFVRLSPWRRRVAIINSIEFHVVVLQSGDIVASRDLATQMRAGDLSVGEFAVKRGGHLVQSHMLQDRDGNFHVPQVGVMPEDF